MGAYVGQLGRDLGIAPSTVSHHIKELRQAGLICLKRHGRNVECRVEAALLRELAEFFAAADSCCAGASARRECQ
jgi:ArsR family transcriptional regulator, arsenate/arsenite/antimonite-responsive transcriptional repressor